MAELGMTGGSLNGMLTGSGAPGVAMHEALPNGGAVLPRSRPKPANGVGSHGDGAST